MEQPVPQTSTALVVGVTGMAGLSLAEALKSPTAPGGPWTVYGVARRPPPPWFPHSSVDSYIHLDALDSAATNHSLSPIAPCITHLFWVALATRDTEESNIAANTTMLANVLAALTPSSALRHVTLQTGTKQYIGPCIDPALINRIPTPDLPFREDAPRLPVPLFYYSLEDILMTQKIPYSVHRSSIIIGASARSAYNLLLALAVYASICRREGTLFRFMGSEFAWESFCDATDADVLAAQHVWAATTPAARGEAFNCTNGDVFTWKGMWTALAEEFGVEAAPPTTGESEGWVERIMGKGAVWDSIVEEEGLWPTRMEEVCCFGALYALVNFGFQHVCSVNKSREFEFHGFADSVKSARKWVRRLRDMNLVPRV